MTKFIPEPSMGTGLRSHSFYGSLLGQCSPSLGQALNLTWLQVSPARPPLLTVGVGQVQQHAFRQREGLLYQVVGDGPQQGHRPPALCRQCHEHLPQLLRAKLLHQLQALSTTAAQGSAEVAGTAGGRGPIQCSPCEIATGPELTQHRPGCTESAFSPAPGTPGPEVQCLQPNLSLGPRAGDPGPMSSRACCGSHLGQLPS